MTMTLPQMLGALGMAQATKVAPALAGRYEGGDAGTTALLLLLLAQEATTLPPRSAAARTAMAALLGEDGDHDALLAKLAARHAEIDGRTDAPSRDLEKRILALYLEMAEAAFLTAPQLG